MKTHSVVVNRQNGGQIDLGDTYLIKKLAIKQIHFDGKELEETECIHILFNGLASGLLHLNKSKLEYTKFVTIEEIPTAWEKDSCDPAWDWEGEPKEIKKLNILVYADRKLVKNIDMCIEFYIE